MKIKTNEVGEFIIKLLLSNNLTQKKAAELACIHPAHFNDLILSRRKVSVECDLKITKLFGYEEGYIINMQFKQEAKLVKKRIKNILDKIKPINKAE